MHSTSHLRISCHSWEWGRGATCVHASLRGALLAFVGEDAAKKSAKRGVAFKNFIERTPCWRIVAPLCPSTDLLVSYQQITHGSNEEKKKNRKRKKGAHVRRREEFVKGLIAGLEGVTVTWHFTGFAFHKTGVIRFAMKAYQTFSWIAAGLPGSARRSHPQSVSAKVECSSAGGATAG